MRSAMGIVKTFGGNNSKAEQISKATRTSPADAVSQGMNVRLDQAEKRICLDFLEWLQGRSDER